MINECATFYNLGITEPTSARNKPGYLETTVDKQCGTLELLPEHGTPINN